MNCCKKFDRALYEQCDTFGKTVAKKFMSQEGYKLTSEVEAYKSHDLIFAKDGKHCKVEVEMNLRWMTQNYPYQTLTVPYRKKDSKADFYIMVSKNGEGLLTIPMAEILSAPTIVKDTRYTKQERFFCLPISNARIYFLQDGYYYPIEDDKED